MSLSQCSGSCSVFRRIYTFNYMSGCAHTRTVARKTTVSENNKHAGQYHQKINTGKGTTRADKHVHVSEHL
ncbi:hypothetical protein EUGRSUZ_E04275 [Eucalyptus grandis]|uniref:Uncharacterized protein n=2 Tax=Eucalyptus grandis TaxID=71139 RepID=A0ACC3L197_EUCGR|nr:hypothetical protein EUGRSUZ_E04275 [Eucalyptus grandis]